jgi:hypothetical protein
MSFKRGLVEDEGERHQGVGLGAGMGLEAGSDPEMGDALRHFRQSVHAWSETVYQRARVAERAPRRNAWGRAAAWTLGCVLVAGGAGGGWLEYRHHQEQTRIAVAREARHQRQLQEERAREAEQELAQVDRDISRDVPDALQPLARLMITDESQ